MNLKAKMEASLLGWQLPGEKPLTISSLTLNMTIGKVFFKDAEGTGIGDGLTKVVLPTSQSLGLALTDPTKNSFGCAVRVA